MPQHYESIDTYIQTFPQNIQDKLQEIRSIIKQSAPDATEAISYDMPTFKLQGKNLIHFAAWKDHLALYPTPNVTEAPEFADDLAGYTATKGSVHLPLDKPIPKALIVKMVEFRIANVQK